MEEPVSIIPSTNNEASNNRNGKAVKNGKTVKRVVVFIALAIAGYLVYYFITILLSPDRNVRQIYLVPKDAAIIIESDDPVNDWKKFSNSETWKCLEQAQSFAYIAGNMQRLDSIFKANNKLLSLAGKRDMIISFHQTRLKDWDFLIVLDLQKISKVNMLKNQIEQIYKMAGFTVTNRKYKGNNITESRDPETRDILFSAFVDNHLVISYTSRLVEASIDEREQPGIGLDLAFIDAEKLVGGKGLSRIYVNYAFLPQFLSIYMDKNEYVDMFSNSMDYAGLYLSPEKDKLEVTGFTFLKDEPNPYLAAFLNSGKHKMKAHEIMSARTAFYLNLGFGDHITFVRELEQALSINNTKSYDAYKVSREKLEKYFDISMEENFLSWMSGELALSLSEPGLLGNEPELILAIRAKDIKKAYKNMDFIETRIKKRTPIQVKSVNFDDFEIKYIELKGFFRLFFGGLLDDFEKPYYTYVDDFVVFSNKPSSLLSFVADYKQKNLMKGNEEFQTAFGQVKTNSNLFVFLDTPKFYYQLRPLLNEETWTNLKENKEVLFSFPQWTFQVVGEKDNASMQWFMHYRPSPSNESLTAQNAENLDLIEEAAEEDDNETERELMNELKRFYVEKFQGNILRDFYSDGSIKSESEVNNGKRNGRYREFHENGNLKVRGRYVNNQPRGTWKYYTGESKFERKEKY